MGTKEFFDELTFWVLLVIGALFVIVPTKAFLKVAAAKTGNEGLMAAVAS